MSAPILEARNVTKRFGGLTANEDVSLVLGGPVGQVISVIGPNGAGKSTFFKCLTGQLKPSAGDVLFRGIPNFAPEILTGALPPAVLAAYASREFGPGAFAGAAAVVVLLYGAELTLAALARFPLSWRMPGAMIVRDLALPVLWIDAWLNSDFTWHGQEMSVKAARQ